MSMESRPETLPTHTPELFREAVRRAVERLRAGDAVALPTETVYGLAANALDPRAVARIFEIKGRPANNPVIVHVASHEMARRCAREWPEAAQRLAAAFWPGPLTIVAPKALDIPPIVTAGGDTVGVRWPSHPLMQAVIRECGFPLAAPSANPSNALSPTSAGHVASALGPRLALIVDGGQSQVGIESTVVDVTASPVRILRPGIVHSESFEAVLGEVEFAAGESTGMATALRSPGQFPRHYAPRAKLLVLSWTDAADLGAQLEKRGLAARGVCILAHSRVPMSGGFARVAVVPHDAEAFARALYAELHACDAAGAECIVVEAPPAGVEWEGIADRLRRASTEA
jgi:L-threonylcarbamoyladenylate synthase